jgi:hypothetical protein
LQQNTNSTIITMKFTILVSTLFQAIRTATAAKGIHLRQTTPVVEEAIPNVFQSVVEVLNQCTNETAALADCYGDYGKMETCAECAWTRVLNEMNQGCIGINEIAVSDYQACIDTPIPNTESTYCNNNCNNEPAAVWDCARPLYLVLS